MAAMKKIVGFLAGVSAVAVVGVAVAQGVPPNPFVSNPALAAGQQSTHLTAMGETGVPAIVDQVATAQATTVQQAAVVEQPAVVAQAPVQEQQQMGAAPAPVEEAPAPRMVRRHDRG